MSKNDVTVICNTTDRPEVIAGHFSFLTTTCLIYAEVVEIEDDLRLVGKSIRIFCSKLVLRKKSIHINVSGKNGEMAKPQQSQPGDSGNHGTASNDI
jgi:hypothetical protein